LFVQINDLLKQLLDFVVFVADLALEVLEHDVGKHPRNHQCGGLLKEVLPKGFGHERRRIWFYTKDGLRRGVNVIAK
jgi:hypothetical protein